LGPRAGQKVLTLKTVPNPKIQESLQPAKCGVNAEGYSLHAEVRCAMNQRNKLERLCRQITRPAIANERLKRNSAGDPLWPSSTRNLKNRRNHDSSVLLKLLKYPFFIRERHIRQLTGPSVHFQFIKKGVYSPYSLPRVPVFIGRYRFFEIVRLFFSSSENGSFPNQILKYARPISGSSSVANRESFRCSFNPAFAS